MLIYSMNQLIKKTNLAIIISFIALFFGTVLLLLSEQFITTMYDFLAHRIYHREFNLQKWLPTIESLLSIPLFLVISLNAIFFPKYNEKQKVILVSGALISLAVSIIYCGFTATTKHVNSDIAAEFILAKECFLTHSIFPTSYYYATELRTLNTELISAPIFMFTNNLVINKTITIFFTCFFCFITTWNFLKVLKIKTVWQKILISFLIFAPFSYTAIYIGTWGNFYIPHTICTLIFVSIFVNLVNHNYKKEKIWMYFFFAFSFFCGLSTIRYVLNFLIPMSIAAIYLKKKKKGSESITDLNNFWLGNFIVRISVINIFTAGFGYIFSSVVLQHFYTLSHFNKIQFCNLGETSFLTLFRTILTTYGYREGVSVMTPSGVINLLVISGLSLTVYCIYKLLKSDMTYTHRLILVFCIFSFFFNTFIYYTVEFYTRYYYAVLILIFPIIAIIFDSEKLFKPLKYILGVSWAIVLLTSSFLSIANYLNTDENANRKGYINFLEDNNYTFGYSIFDHANVTIFLTNEKIIVGNLSKTKPNNSFDCILDDKYDYSKWLTAKRFYETKHEGPVFLLLDMHTYNLNKEKNIVKNGKPVYQDDSFIVFDYESNEKFKESF